MATTISESVSRVRNSLKAVKEDAFLTDRFIYSIILKYAKLFIKRQDNENKIMKFQSLFEPLPCVELIEVDKIEAGCSGIKSGTKIMRTKDKLPTLLEGAYGPLFRTISSMDGSQEVIRTYPSTYVDMTNSTNFKYNKSKYYWYLDGYLYFPNITWEAVRVEGLFEDSTAAFKPDGDVCKLRQDDPTHFPEFLFAEIEQMVLKEFTMMLQIPIDNGDDSQSLLR
jgi:hypothetical protein